jgi:hypothetical protein
MIFDININKKLAAFSFIGIMGLNFGSAPSATAAGIETKIENNIKSVVRSGVQKFRDTRGTVSGTVTIISTSALTINNNGISTQIDISSKTHFARKFWGGSNLNEISVGDNLEVVGRWTSDAKTEIAAVTVRDLSIQKRFGVFFGTVKSFTDGGFVMATIHRDDEMVIFGTAKITDKKGGNLGQSDIKMGDRVRVRGMWNNTLKTITEVVEIRDFSLPLNSN